MSRLALLVGASSGVGAATAKELSRRGWTVVLSARSEERLAFLARLIGPNASYKACDATLPSDVAALEAFVRRRHGVPDAVINCAGLGQWKRLQDTSPDELRLMIGSPYLAAANASRMFLNDMLDRRSGTLIHVNSPACYMPWPSAVGYTASRFALRGLHEALSQDLAGTGVRTCHVVFGRIDSEYFDHNPGVAERMPGIAATIRSLAVEECASVLADVAARP
ncbi:MAG: SDR family oxidoreductase, partial [Betaproteobacteria bacterium]|nr:SDR family oxidoreductase [Betaproteobacteria bacterium]